MPLAHRLRSVYALLGLCLVIGGPVFAQTETATLSGVINDPKGGVVPDVEVAATRIETGTVVTTKTNGAGIYAFTSLMPGHYHLLVSKPGFKEIAIKELELHVQDKLEQNFSLELGSVSESVTVNADDVHMTRTDGSVGTVVDRQFVADMPLNGRSFQSLITLSPGVVLTKASSGAPGQFSVNGQRSNANYFTIDGVGANLGVSPSNDAGQSTGGTLPGFGATGGTNNLVSVDAMQEFKILTSTFAPEFGRTPGAQVSIVTRSGTNSFHGTLFEYFRNDALDATDWFADSRGLQKPPLRQNDFGATFSGPVLLPRFGEGGRQPWYNGRNKTFVFFSYEGLRLRLPQTAIKTVPTLTLRKQAPTTMQPFLNAYPLPTGPEVTAGFAASNATYSDPTTLDATSIRVDQILSNKLTMFVRYNYAPSSSVQRGASSFALNTISTTRVNTQTLTGGLTLAITSAINNDFRVNYSRNRGTFGFSMDTSGGAVPAPDSLIFPTPLSSENSSFRFTLSGLTWTNGVFGVDLQRQVNLVDTLSVVQGGHQFKIGVDYRRVFPIFDRAHYQQTIIFNNVTAVNSSKASSAFVQAFDGPRQPVFNNFSVFGQDTWRATKRLTLTYGLRWEVNAAPSDASGTDPLTVTGLDNLATVSLAPAGTPLYPARYNNFAPRIGMAYRLSEARGRETIVRGGFGVFYDLGNGTIATAFGGAFPYSRLKTLPANTAFPLDSASAAPPTINLTPPLSNIRVVDPRFNLPYTYQWNAAIEQSLGRNQTVTASYLGSVGQRLARTERINNPDATVTSLIVTRSDDTSDYHALQLQFQRRLSRGLQALASYTWSHSIDLASTDSVTEVPIPGVDRSQRRGPSDFDVRHVFSGAATYDIPVAKGNSFSSALFRGFSVDAIFTARSATPVNVLMTSSSTLRPDLVSGVPLYLDDPLVGSGRRINLAAFTAPPNIPGTANPARQGTLGRNALRGFGMWQLDFALRHQFTLAEAVKLQLRAELFNAFNHPNFGDPGSAGSNTNALNDALFGQSTVMLNRSLGGSSNSGFNPLYQVGGPRSIQLAVKVVF